MLSLITKKLFSILLPAAGRNLLHLHPDALCSGRPSFDPGLERPGYFRTVRDAIEQEILSLLTGDIGE